MGECLEFLITEKIPLVLIGHAKSNNPKGLLQLTLKFMTSLLITVQKHNLLAQSDTHQAVFQLLNFIYNSLNNDGTLDLQEADLLVKFLKVLLLESKRCGMEGDLFLSNSSQTDAGHIPL